MDIKTVLAAARDYVPTAEKTAFVADCAEKCFDTLQITTGAAEALPTMYKENAERKEKYMLGALLRLYLGVEYAAADTEKDKWLMNDIAFDEFAAMHLVNQIERAKSDAALRDKCFDLLQDYKALEKRLNAEVYGLMNVMNDAVTRLLASVESTVTPERIRDLSAELTKAQADLQAFKEGNVADGG